MRRIFQTIRSIIKPLSFQFRFIGNVFFYLRARELGFPHSRIVRALKGTWRRKERVYE